MAVRNDRSDVKQTTTGFRGPLMAQSLASAKSKVPSLPLPEGGWKQSVIDDLTKNKGLTLRQVINKHGGN